MSTDSTPHLGPDPDLDEFELDLDAARAARAEVSGRKRGIKVGGHVLDLPAELPLDVLEPLSQLDVDVSLLIRQALDAYRGTQGDGETAVAQTSAQQNAAVMDAVINMIVMNPNLPQDIVAAVKTMAARLLGETGYAHLVEARLTIPEIGKLARFLGRRYGVGLGESSPSSDSSEGTGTTSKPTSSLSTAATSAVSGGALAPMGS